MGLPTVLPLAHFGSIGGPNALLGCAKHGLSLLLFQKTINFLVKIKHWKERKGGREDRLTERRREGENVAMD